MLSDSVFYENILTITSSVSAPHNLLQPLQAHKEASRLSKCRNTQAQGKSSVLHHLYCDPDSSWRHCGIERVISPPTPTYFQSHCEPQTPVYI